MPEQNDASEVCTVALLYTPPPSLFHLTCFSVLEACLFGVVLIASACVFGLCWLGGEHAWCRADGVPSAPYGSAVPSTLLSHRERRADRLLQGEHHFLRPSLPHTQTLHIIVSVPCLHLSPTILLPSNFLSRLTSIQNVSFFSTSLSKFP